MKIDLHSEVEMKTFGARLGACLRGGELIELVGDVGAGKTTLTKGIAEGLGVSEDIQSPSFTISRVYNTSNHLQFAHYDFYRLSDPGIMTAELHETLHEPYTVTVIEWAEIVGDILPADRLTIQMIAPSETTRQLTLTADGEKSNALLEQIA